MSDVAIELARLTEAEACLERGESVPEEVYKALDKTYGQVLGRSECPCRSGKQFFECCRLRWQVVERGQKKIAHESREQKKEDARAENRAGTPAEKVRLVCSIGIGENGRMIVNPSDENADPTAVAKLILLAYHGLMTDTMLDGFDQLGEAINNMAQRIGRQ